MPTTSLERQCTQPKGQLSSLFLHEYLWRLDIVDSGDDKVVSSSDMATYEEDEHVPQSLEQSTMVLHDTDVCIDLIDAKFVSYCL